MSKTITCRTCGKLLKPEEVCKLHGYTQCITCAFPNGDSQKLYEFEKKRAEYNLHLLKLHKSRERKRKLKNLITGVALSIIMLLLGICLRYFNLIGDSGIFVDMYSGAFSGLVLSTLYMTLHNKPFVPMDVKEFNNYLKNHSV